MVKAGADGGDTKVRRKGGDMRRKKKKIGRAFLEAGEKRAGAPGRPPLAGARDPRPA